jgi:16S rRNA (guanine1207-N2)-methyltransferase
MYTGSGELTIKRPHTPTSSPLRAWSTADVLVIDELVGKGGGSEPARESLGRLLIINDEFGALTCALAASEPTVWTDSVLSRLAIDQNLEANGLPAMSADRHVRGHEQPVGSFDTIVVRIPKTSALLEHQLRVVASIAEQGASVVGAGMTRHIHNSTIAAFDKLIGPTTTSRATRKARLIHTKPNGQSEPSVELGADEFVTSNGVRIVELPGTFSAGHLDVGSALLLKFLSGLPVLGESPRVVDLGCGNGAIAAEIATYWHDAHFLLLDVSDLAVEAATRTWKANGLGPRMTAQVADGFASTQTQSVDIVITNPPFHQGHAQDHEMTERLLADMARVLRPGGVAYVVAQRHLNLHTRMRQWFTSVEVPSQHPSHVVLVATNDA